ncbi:MULTISPECIES: alpha/beta fold hydrolase [unclassified Streptomyces]|uniref:alpha/beta fold hydrolase n=1 Tax=unclassified Streptomyces TaxID=2593676 RepID=UPI00278BC661|nr:MULTISPECIES: alpha/beta fold hydrolase [unclassified Streptomyces]
MAELYVTDVHVEVSGPPQAPAVLLVHGSAGSLEHWDPVVPALAETFRVIRVDLPGCGRSPAPKSGGFGVPAQARRVGAVLDDLGVERVTVVGHSSGCMVATALAEQRAAKVTAVALIDMGPDPNAQAGESPLVRLLSVPVVGPLLWRLRTPDALRRAAATAVTRPVPIPDSYVEGALAMTHRAFVGTMRGYRAYLGQRGLPERLAPLGLPVFVLFGAEDRRWRSSSAQAYRAVPGARIELLPGVGHTPMLEATEETAALLREFAATATADSN